MPAFNLQQVDPLIATNFFLEISGSILTTLTSVEGLTMEIEKAEVNQRLDKGVLVQHVAMSKAKWTGELTVKRLAPLDSSSDELWKWFNSLRTSGMSATNRTSTRKDGSVVVYDPTMTEIARWNFTAAWPSKIASDGMEVGKNDPVSETITFQYETLARIK